MKPDYLDTLLDTLLTTASDEDAGITLPKSEEQSASALRCEELNADITRALAGES